MSPNKSDSRSEGLTERAARQLLDMFGSGSSLEPVDSYRDCARSLLAAVVWPEVFAAIVGTPNQMHPTSYEYEQIETFRRAVEAEIKKLADG